MFTERRLGAWFEKIRLEWRGLGKTKYLPFIVNYIVLPLFVVVCANASYMNKEDYYFAENGSYFIPFMSVWWMILILQEYVEGIGSEVIRIYDKNKMPEMFFYFAIYILSIIPISVFAVKVWKVDVDTIEAPTDEPKQPVVKETKVGRNDLCPCGSGKKYKNCCGKN